MTETFYPLHASASVLQLQLWMVPSIIREPITVNVMEQRR